MATTGKRKEREPEMEPLWTEGEIDLPNELAVMLFEAAEESHRGVEISKASRLTEVDKLWRIVAVDYARRKRLKMKIPPGILTLLRVRLFRSPRAKYLNGLSWEVTSRLFELYDKSVGVPTIGSTPEQSVYLFVTTPIRRSTHGKTWHLGSLVSGREELGESKWMIFPQFGQFISLQKGPPHPGGETHVTRFILNGPPPVEETAILYGHGTTLFSFSQTDFHARENIKGLRSMVMDQFLSPGDPDPSLLSWKDKVVIVRAKVGGVVLPLDVPADHPLRRPGWGYDFGAYFSRNAMLSSTVLMARGLLVMPASWFFHFYDPANRNVAFGASVAFEIDVLSFTIVKIASTRIITYQPTELLFLDEGITSDELEDLFMVQILSPERASARLTETW